MPSRLTRTVASVIPPAGWSAVARSFRMAQSASSRKALWSARTGLALKKAGRLAEAQAAYLEALGTAWPPPQSAAADVWPSWYFHLGTVLRRLGDTSGALQAFRAACAPEGAAASWHFHLGAEELKAKNHLQARAALEYAMEQEVAHPRLPAKLGEVYSAMGRWDKTEELLRQSDEGHGMRALAEAKLERAKWGGVIDDDTEAFVRDDPADVDMSAVRSEVSELLRGAAELLPHKYSVHADLADAETAVGDLSEAVAEYRKALEGVDVSSGRWVLSAKHRWQFRLHSLLHAMGEPEHKDPLFDCVAEPDGEAIDPATPPAGCFELKVNFNGLSVSGFALDRDCEQVEVLVGGTVLRAVNLGAQGHLPKLSFTIRRETVALFPSDAPVEVRSAASGASWQAPQGRTQIRLQAPHGSGSIGEIIDAGGVMDKKGVLSPSHEETKARQQRYLEIYAQARDFFDKELGRSLFLMYGTLLGFHREGDFIPGDDDFDAGYVSDLTDPQAVKEETMDIIVQLVKAGFTVSFNRRGRLFRFQLEKHDTGGFHLDLRPLWFEEGKVWVHNHASFPSDREKFLPVAEGKLRGSTVYAPRDTEHFLRGHYGPGWKVPDPGFIYYAAEVDPYVRQNLAAALITVDEYRELAARVERETADLPDAGRFVSVGSQDLYPLEEFLA